MAFGISRIFRSTDVGAPVWTNNSIGSLTNLLKAVLVNGYGSIQSLGWTTEFDAGNITAFRMKGGTRTYIRFDDTTWNSLAHAEVSAFATMNTRDTGTERIPTIGVSTYIQKFYSTSVGTNPWIIIGDDAGFWFLYKYMSTYGIYYNNRYCAVYFGDYNAWDIRNKWNFTLMASNTPLVLSVNSISEGLTIHGIGTTVPHHYVARGNNFARGCIQVGTLPFSGNGYFGQNMLVAPGLGPLVNKVNGVWMQSPIHIYDSVILGSLPGVYEPVMQDYNATSNAALTNTEKIEVTDSNGELSIFIFLLNNLTNLSNIGKVIFRVGNGFRNVQ